MKVWELMAALSKFRAGDEVSVSLAHTCWTDINTIEQVDDGSIGILGGDTQLSLDDGEEGEWLSSLANS